MPDIQAQTSSQETHYDMTFVDGSRHQIRLRTIILHAMLITRERQRGSFREAFIPNGSQQVPTRFFGSMESVRRSPTSCLTTPDNILFVQLARARPFFGQ